MTGNRLPNSTAQTWYGSDALGSVRQTLDATGAPLSALHYDPWGTPQGGATPPVFGFTGELQDATSGLVYLRARWYQPQHGRFLSRDPFAGVDRMPVSLHPYQYGYTSPIRYTDPSGQHPGVCLLPAVADGPIPAGDVVTVGCAIVYAVGALVSTIAGQAAGEATGQIIRDQGLRGYYQTGTPAPVLSPRQVPPTTIMPPAPVGSGVRPFPGYADPQDGCAVPGFTPLPDVLRQRGRPGPILLPGQGPTILAANLESIFKKHPSTSMKCDICANQAAKELSAAGYDVDIVRLTNSDPRAPYMLAKGGKLVGITGFHEVVRINMPHGPLYIDSLVYETYGATPVDWETYKNLWEYPDDIVQSTSRKPK
ncbi:RHS repeat-associated core domain-containing protein [Kallotenue papyrolyticum]|uniref:RHS repeat-associated core domain-containing protein n=1 Tax=Kallotenue papyrolyticum TaxID=1325125 RepID=UPI0023ED006E|nr:RHS repeat-associated core domain-containing protein [Kallotenue papyrolyticum]